MNSRFRFEHSSTSWNWHPTHRLVDRKRGRNCVDVGLMNGWSVTAAIPSGHRIAVWPENDTRQYLLLKLFYLVQFKFKICPSIIKMVLFSCQHSNFTSNCTKHSLVLPIYSLKAFRPTLVNIRYKFNSGFQIGFTKYNIRISQVNIAKFLQIKALTDSHQEQKSVDAVNQIGNTETILSLWPAHRVINGR